VSLEAFDVVEFLAKATGIPAEKLRDPKTMEALIEGSGPFQRAIEREKAKAKGKRKT
jgi:hypothetical protein